MRRRAWLRAALGGIGALAASGLRGPAALARAARRPLGLQLYTVRTLMEEDVAATLQAVAGIGYEEVELAGLHGLTPGEMRRTLDRVGLAAPSGHVSLEALRSEPDRVLADAHVLGHRWVTVPWIPEALRTPDGYRQVADELNRAGARAREAGIGVAYHNHAFEMEAFDGRQGLAFLLDDTDPELVSFQLDVFWVVHGGSDPLVWLEAWPRRFVSLHAKDRTIAGEMVAVGEGAILFQHILRTAERNGVAHVFVEHDNPADPLESVRTSYEYLKSLEI